MICAFGMKNAIAKPIKFTIDSTANMREYEGNSNNLNDNTGAMAVPMNNINVLIER